MLLWSLILGTLLGLPVAVSDRGDSCGDASNSFTIHVDKDGNNIFCCEEKQCRAGFAGIICVNNDDPYSSRCERCPEGKFILDKSKTSDGRICQRKKICDPNQGYKVLSEGSEKEDRKCVCDQSLGYYEGSPDYCIRKSCPAGTQLTEKGLCEECPFHYFKKTNRTHVCKLKTDCAKLGLIHGEDDDPYSRFEDSHCVNGTGLNPKPIEITTSSETEVETTVFVLDESVDKAVWYIPTAISVIILFVIVLVVLASLFFWQQRKKNRNAEFPLVVHEKEAQQCSPDPRVADEHDENETSPLTLVQSTVPRGPSETDERECIHTPNRGQTVNGKQDRQYLRQTTIDSGYGNGNSSGSERGSLEFQMESAPNTPMSAGLKSGAPVFPRNEHTSLPSTVNEHTSLTAGPALCEHCGKSQDGVTSTPIHNSYHVYGPNSTVQICGGDCGQNTVNTILPANNHSYEADSCNPSTSSNASTPDEETAPEIVIVRNSSDDPAPTESNSFEMPGDESGREEVAMFRRVHQHAAEQSA